MSEAFEKHRDKKVREMRDKIRNSETKKTEGMETFGQCVEKAWKNINEIKSN